MSISNPHALNVRHFRSICVIESPYSGYDRAEEFARFCCRKAFDEGFSPWASHLFHPQFLADESAIERQEGIQLGVRLIDDPSTVWLCVPLDHCERPSVGMLEGTIKHVRRGCDTVEILYFADEDGIWREHDERGQLL